MNVSWDTMVRTAGMGVAKTVTLPADVTGLPEAVTEDVNQDGQETPVIRNVSPGNMEKIVSRTVAIVKKDPRVTMSTDSVWKDALPDTMDHAVLNLVDRISME